MRAMETFLDAVGQTPLVRLHNVTRGVKPTILAKLEMLNPGGSVKDRIGLRMIEAAEGKYSQAIQTGLSRKQVIQMQCARRREGKGVIEQHRVYAWLRLHANIVDLRLARKGRAISAYSGRAG